jgi:vacuolar-type H+-ATPase subunit B/Vma2
VSERLIYCIHNQNYKYQNSEKVNEKLKEYLKETELNLEDKVLLNYSQLFLRCFLKQVEGQLNKSIQNKADESALSVIGFYIRVLRQMVAAR